jgi:hypothetical protein
MNKLNDRYHYINFGGCCVIASYMADQLHKLGIPVRIVVAESLWATSYFPHIDKVRRKLNNTVNTARDWNSKGIEFGHVVVEVKINNLWHILDTEHGCLPSKEYWKRTPRRPFGGYLTLHEARFLAGRGDGWNPSFDRDQIKGIKQMISKYITKVAQSISPTAC